MPVNFLSEDQKAGLLVGNPSVESVLYAAGEKRRAGVVRLQYEVPDGYPVDEPCGGDGGKSVASASTSFSRCY